MKRVIALFGKMNSYPVSAVSGAIKNLAPRKINPNPVRKAIAMEMFFVIIFIF